MHSQHAKQPSSMARILLFLALVWQGMLLWHAISMPLMSWSPIQLLPDHPALHQSHQHSISTLPAAIQQHYLPFLAPMDLPSHAELTEQIEQDHELHSSMSGFCPLCLVASLTILLCLLFASWLLASPSSLLFPFPSAKPRHGCWWRPRVRAPPLTA